MCSFCQGGEDENIFPQTIRERDWIGHSSLNVIKEIKELETGMFFHSLSNGFERCSKKKHYLYILCMYSTF